MKTAYIFPGQGAQVVGMGKDIAQEFPVAAEMFKKADEIVGYGLSDLCFEGPQDKLNTTTVSQPAIFATSAAILEVLRTEAGDKVNAADVTAGLSLGEYTALYAAGLMSFEDGLKLVQKRGEAMQAAADESKGSMVSILRLDEDKLNDLIAEASEGKLLVAANFNCPGQIVISGDIDACSRAVELAEKYGAMKAIQLAVAGAFHSEYMQPASDDLKLALDAADITAPKDTAVIANINAEYYKDAAEVREGLCKQLTSPILWQNCMERLIAEGCESFYEIGPGRVLTGLMKKINRKTKVVNLSTADAVKALIG
ncbi:MAG: ACP S-malonyltransferase [Sedimentisphaeraceae bacterium JB056]